MRAHIEHLPVELPQVGTVYIYNLSDPSQPVTLFNGDRAFGRFGAHLKVRESNEKLKILLKVQTHYTQYTPHMLGCICISFE